MDAGDNRWTSCTDTTQIPETSCWLWIYSSISRLGIPWQECLETSVESPSLESVKLEMS